jgi:hypothetical protein
MLNTSNNKMLDNYKKIENGLIKQMNKKPFSYGAKYTSKYDKYGIQKINMSHLRLGYVLGSIGKKPEKILDVGYGQGHFLEVAKNIIPKCFGNDVTEECPVPEGTSFIKNIFEQSYDIVTFFDSLEHFENIYDIKNLKTNHIAVSLPWCQYKGPEWFDTWKHRRPDEHLWFFDDNSLTNFMNEIGFKKINTCNIEDVIRKDSNNQPNILSGVFEKI